MINQINFKYLLSAFMLVFFLAPAPQPQSLDDWKAALGAAQSGKGCESIPYSSHRDQCMRKSEKVEESCKTESWSCEGLKTKGIRETIQNLSGYIERLKEEKDRLNSQKSSASSDEEKNDLGKKIEDIEKKIYEKSKDLDDMKKGLETDIGDIEIRLYKGRQCLDARNDVQSVFKSAAEDAKRESDPDIKSIANQLIDFWERKRDEHQKALDDVKLGIEKCNKCKDGDL
jgi:predicted  nucleic acid-binding Zn-ribbon protein